MNILLTILAILYLTLIPTIFIICLVLICWNSRELDKASKKYPRGSD